MIYSPKITQQASSMLSYQHAYHAGNFADVVKHIVLCRILTYMSQKDKALLYLETHSGRGIYDLQSSQSSKTLEFQKGIALVWEARDEAPAVLQPYLEVLKTLNPDGRLRYYPGSPYYALALLRKQDRLLFSERHGQEFSHLTQIARGEKRVFFNEGDGMLSLKAEMPPIERRACIFIDPSFEIKDEYKTMPEAIRQAYLRFATGVYGLWYPIVDNRLHQQVTRGLKNIGADKFLQIEFYLSPKFGNGMRGSGLGIINPPFSLAAEMKIALEFLCTIFNEGQSSYLIS